MTISDTPNKFRYQGNGVTDAFAFSGKAFTAADLIVEIITRATDALVETLTITTHYSVTIATDGTASVTVVSGKIPSSLQDIQIRRSLAQTQSVVLPTGTKFPAKSVESAIDRAVGLSQDLEEAVNRSLKFRATSSTTVATLPEPVDDAVLCFDGTTGLFKVGATNTTLTASATAAAASASAASASATAASNSASAASASATAASNSADDAAASAAGVNLPSVTVSDATKLLKVNAGGTAFELAAKLPNFTANKRGTIFVQNAADDGFEALSLGTAGQVLTSAGDDALPTWGVAGALVLLQTQTASSSASIAFSSTYLTSTYKNYLVVITDLIPATDITTLSAQISQDNGSNYLAANYSYIYTRQTTSTQTVEGVASQSSWVLNNNATTGNAATEGLCLTLLLNNPANTSRYKTIECNISNIDESGIIEMVKGVGMYSGTPAAYNNIKFAMSSGNIASGTFKLYGIL